MSLEHTDRALMTIKEINEAKMKAKLSRKKTGFFQNMSQTLATEVNEPTQEAPEPKVEVSQFSKEDTKAFKNAEKDMKKEKDDVKNCLQKGHYVENLKVNEAYVKMNTYKQSGYNVKLQVLDTRKRDAKQKDLIESRKIEIGQHELFYSYSEKYYREVFGFPMSKIPKKILKSKEFKRIPVERALQIFYQLGLRPKDSYLFRHALLLDALPLPPEIQVDYNKEKPRYFFDGKIMNNVFKPSLFYIQNNIEHLKELNKDRVLVAPKVVFCDKIGRDYRVDLESLYKKWLKDPTKRKFIEYNSDEPAKKDLFQATMNYKEIKREYKNIIVDIMGENYSKDPVVKIPGEDDKQKNISSSKKK